MGVFLFLFHFAGRFTLVVAHRLSTIRDADKVVVLENGSVVEYGMHDELLMRDGGAYKALLEAQQETQGWRTL